MHHITWFQVNGDPEVQKNQSNNIQSIAVMDSFPQGDAEHPANPNNQITIGDLHGNALKLIYFLVRRNVLDIPKADYQEIVRIYNQSASNITKADLMLFENILTRSKYKFVGTIRLIGDELADRGNNDFLTLLILKKLGQENISVEILLSNHGVEFIESYEKKREFNQNRLGYQACSAVALQQLIKEQVITKKEIDSLINKYYKPCLRAISYTINSNRTKISVFSHAPIGLNTIQAIAKRLNVAYADVTAQELANTIDTINEVFSKYVTAEAIHTLYTDENISLVSGGKQVNQNDCPFEFMMWNRSYTNITRPNKHHDYHVDFIHGHDSCKPSHDNIYNLDNTLGKVPFNHSGCHNIHFSMELPSKYGCKLREEKSETDTKEEAKPESKQEETILHQTIQSLKNICADYQIYLDTVKEKNGCLTRKSTNMKKIINEMQDILLNRSSTSLVVLDSFYKKFANNQSNFNLYHDPDTKAFISRVCVALAIALASVPTLGMVAACVAFYAHTKKRNITTFWKEGGTQTEEFIKKVNHELFLSKRA